MSSKAIYAFSGDPITYGHIDIIKRACHIFDKVIVAIGTNPEKKYTFSPIERETLAKGALESLPKVIVKSFSGLLVDFAYEQEVDVIVKGVRNPEDFRYEQTLSHVGLSQNQGIETILLFAKPNLAHVSSSTVKALQKEHGATQHYVPLGVKIALEKKLSEQIIIGITGEVATGKSHLANQLIEIGNTKKVEVHNIELDQLAHQIQDDLIEPIYVSLRKKIVEQFGKKILKKDGKINRKVLGEIVFKDLTQLNILNNLMWKPVLVRLRKELKNKKGLILINSALLAEANLLSVCNNRVILASVKPSQQKKYLENRKLSPQQIERRLKSQLTNKEKEKIIKNKIAENNFGKLWLVDENTEISSFAKKIFSAIL